MLSTEDRVRTLVVKLLEVEPQAVTREASFVANMGGDSLHRVEIVMAVEDEFDIEISDEDAEPLDTFGSMVDYVEKRLTHRQ